MKHELLTSSFSTRNELMVRLSGMGLITYTAEPKKRKSFSKRVPVDKVEQYREETENCRRFKELSNRYVLVCEQIADQGTEKKTSEAQEERLSEIVRTKKASYPNVINSLQAKQQFLKYLHRTPCKIPLPPCARHQNSHP